MGIFKKDKDCICIILGEETLKVAHLKVSASAKELANVVKRDIRGAPEEELPKIIKSILSDFNVKKPETICVVPPSVTTTKNIEIPSVNPEEIKSIINLQAGRHTPYSRDEIIIDYVNIGLFQKNYSKILLVIVNRNVVKKQLKVIEDAGLRVEKILFSPESMACFYTRALELSTSEIPFGIIDVGESSTDFIIGFRANAITCRSIPLGIKHLTGDDKASRGNLFAELKKSIESYQNEDVEKLPGSYLLTSESAIIKELQPSLKDELKADVKVVSYLNNLKVGQAARKLIMETESESFLDVIAPLSVYKECTIDLVPEEVKLQRDIEAKGREVAKLGVLSGVALVLICLMFFSKIHFKSIALRSLEKDHKPKRREAESLEQVATKTRIVKDYLSDRLMSLDIVYELYKIIPDEIYLRSLVLNERGTIVLEGTSESMSRVFSLVGALEDSELFKGVKTTSTTAKRERGKDVAAFELALKLEGAREEEEEEEEEKKEEKGK